MKDNTFKYVKDWGDINTLDIEETKALVGFDLERALFDSDVMKEFSKMLPVLMSKFKNENGSVLRTSKKIANVKKFALMSMIQKDIDKSREISSKYDLDNKPRKEIMEIIDCSEGKLPETIKAVYEKEGKVFW